MRRRTGRLGLRACAATLSTGLLVLAAHAGDPFTHVVAVLAQAQATHAVATPANLAADTAPEVTVAPPVVDTTLAPATTAAPPPPPAPPPAPVAPPDQGSWTLGPYKGVGVWVDVYDWSDEATGGHPRVFAEDVDNMANQGIQTLYIQTTRSRSGADVMDPARLMSLVDRAHARGMSVVAWYLPELVDVGADLRKLVAAAQLPVDGLGVDIESLAVGDPALRTQRLLELSTALRQAVGTKAISAITPSAVHLQVVNPGFWPGFPWPELGRTYDVIVPMAYWSVRRAEWRQGARYIADNIDRIRVSTGRPDMPVHVAGGIADGITLDDVTGMITAIQTRGAIGGSLYDWLTSQAPQWSLLQVLRAIPRPLNDIIAAA